VTDVERICRRGKIVVTLGFLVIGIHIAEENIHINVMIFSYRKLGFRFARL
jgi:hypothetical protein